MDGWMDRVRNRSVPEFCAKSGVLVMSWVKGG